VNIFRSSLLLTLVLIVTLVVAACSSDEATPTPITPGEQLPASSDSPTPTPTATPRTDASVPTPTPVPLTSPIEAAPPGFKVFVEEFVGLGFHYPDTWAQGSQLSQFAADAILDNADESVQILFYSGVEISDLSGEERIDQAVDLFRTVLTDPDEVEVRDTLALDSGVQAMRRDFIYANNDGDFETRLFLLSAALRSYVITVSGQSVALDRDWASAEEILRSVVVFEPAMFGVAREHSLTMPWSDPITLDPAMSREGTSHLIVAHLFSGLTRFDDSLAVQLDLAASVDVDDSGTVYTFTLRDDAQFHDGRPITAEDVRYSIERAAEPGLRSATAALYLGDIVGVADKLAGNATTINGVQAVDERTITLTIDAPKAYFLAKLTYPTAYVVDRRNIEPRGYDWWQGSINGSGPFKLREWTEGEVLIIERFDGYHTPSSLPYAVFPINLGTSMQLYEAEMSDVAFIGGSTVDRALDPANGLAEQLRIFPQFLVNYIGFNTTKAPFDDPLVRRAFVMGLDRESLNEIVYQGKVDTAKGLLPPGLPGYNDALEGLPYDPVAAKAALDSSRYAGEAFPEVIFTTSGFGGVPADLQFMIDQWRQNLGVTVDVRTLEPDAYYYALATEIDNLFDYGWIADYPDPQNFLDVLLHSTSVDNNVGHYTNAAYDALIEEARTEQDQARRMALYQEAEQILVDDAAIIPLYHAPDYVLTKPYVQGFSIGPLGIPLLHNVVIGPRE
jgi:oligopeptide transport system substrate-binding protein